MSFSGSVKEELYKHISSARHCQLAETAAILSFCGSIGCQGNDNFLQIEAENALVVRKCFTLLEKTFNIGNNVTIRKDGKNGGYALHIADEALMERILKETRFWEEDSVFLGVRERVSHELIENVCCRRAFLRGAFLAVGSMSDPGKSNHLELVCGQEAQAMQILELLQDFSIEAHIVVRKKYFVVYIKEGSSISDFLNVTEAHLALMEFENFRIVKDMRNSINRRVNCETANISKTVSAAARQT
ncbi:MAG: DNA-binding protein WhiA, partial [Lachnospiraceae bacterium]|nr:DNA-binding protein WhiA [Lachnospiraceae bacterium]